MKKWLKVVGFENYDVNELGQIRNVKTGRILESSKCKNYRLVTLRKNNENYAMYVHIITATAHIPNPLNKPQVNHLNGNGSDNRVENLEWCTSRENIQHAWKTGLCKTKKNSYVSNEDLIGKIFKSNSGKEFIVDRFYKYDEKKALNYFVIRFLDTNNEKIVVKSCIQYGTVGDYYYNFEGKSMERKDIISILKDRGFNTAYIERCLSVNNSYNLGDITINKAINYTI